MAKPKKKTDPKPKSDSQIKKDLEYTQKQITDIFEYFDDRFYIINSNHLASVNTVLGITPKPFLMTWRGDVGNENANRIVREAGDSGARLHDAGETWINGGKVIYNPPMKQYFSDVQIREWQSKKIKVATLINQDEALKFKRFTDWWKIVKPIVISTEVIVYDEELGTAGRLDLLCKIKAGKYNISGSTPLDLPEGVYTVDWKFGKNVDKDSYRQVSTYSKMLSKNAKIDSMGLVVHLNNNQIKGGIEGCKTHFINSENVDKFFNEFKIIKASYDILNTDTPKQYEIPILFERED